MVIFNLHCYLKYSYHDYDTEILYTPVGSHEIILMIIPIAASNDLILEGYDVSNP